MTAPQELVEERDFLLRSLRDLDAEREAGDIDEADYRALRDDYTARAAAAIRALEGRATGDSGSAVTARAVGNGTAGSSGTAGSNGTAGTSGTAGTPGDGSASTAGADIIPTVAPAGRRQPVVVARPRTGSARRRWGGPLVALAVAAVAGLAGWAVAVSAGDRRAGQTITGSVPGATAGTDAALVHARQLLESGKALDAIKAFDQVLRQDPQQPEALAYRGFLLYQAGLPDQALESVDRALAAAPAYPDAHFFRAEILCTARHDEAGAAGEYRAFLAANPPASVASMVQTRLSEAEAGGCQPAPAGTSPAPPAPASIPPAAGPSPPPAAAP